MERPKSVDQSAPVSREKQGLLALFDSYSHPQGTPSGDLAVHRNRRTLLERMPDPVAALFVRPSNPLSPEQDVQGQSEARDALYSMLERFRSTQLTVRETPYGICVVGFPGRNIPEDKLQTSLPDYMVLNALTLGYAIRDINGRSVIVIPKPDERGLILV